MIDRSAADRLRQSRVYQLGSRRWKTMSLMNDATRAEVTHANASTPSVAIFTSVPRHVIVLQSYYVRIFFNTVYYAAGF